MSHPPFPSLALRLRRALRSRCMAAGLLAATLLPVHPASAVNRSNTDGAWSSFNAVSYARTTNSLWQEYLVKNGRLYSRNGRTTGAWSDISGRLNGANQVGFGEITSFDYEVNSDGRASRYLVRGGQVFRSEQWWLNFWGPWENIDNVFEGVGVGRITSFSSVVVPGSEGEPSLRRQFVVRGGELYARDELGVSPDDGLPIWGFWMTRTEFVDEAGAPENREPIRAYHLAYEPLDGNYESIAYLARGNRIYRQSDGDHESWVDVTDTYASIGRSPNARVHAPIYKRVMVLEINPLIQSSGGRPLNEVKGWHDPKVLVQQYIEAMEQASDGIVQYAVSRYVIDRDFPKLWGDWQYTERGYLECVAADNCPYHLFDYWYTLKKHDICELANQGDYDELWLLGGAAFGFEEANMAGPDAFWTNGIPLFRDTSCQVKLNIMGFNYEREMPRMLENTGHRVEGTMKHLFGRWFNTYQTTEEKLPDDINDLEAFTLRDFDPGTAACGNIHGGLNTPVYDPVGNPWNYDFENRHLAPNTCDDWENYPDLTGAITVNDCMKWGCDDLQWHRYWLGKVPAFKGANPRALNNWWWYVLDWDATQ